MADQGSIIERLRAQRKASLAPKSLTLAVPGWREGGSDLLFIRYRPADWERIWALLQGGADLSATDALASNVEALAAACDAFLVPDVEGQYDESLTHDPKGRVSLADVLRLQGENVIGEVKFNAVAVEVLSLTVKDAIGADRAADGVTEACLATFAGAVSPELAIAAHAAALGAWMSGSEEGDSLGESPASPKSS